MSFLDSPVLNHKKALMEGIIESLAHLSRERAMEILLAWHSTEDLERMWPTITSNRRMSVRPKGYQEDFLRMKKALRDVGGDGHGVDSYAGA